MAKPGFGADPEPGQGFESGSLRRITMPILKRTRIRNTMQHNPLERRLFKSMDFCTVVDPHNVNADPNPDSNFHFDAYPVHDPDTEDHQNDADPPGFTHVGKS